MGTIAIVGWGKLFNEPCFLHTQGCDIGAGYQLTEPGQCPLYACHMHLGHAIRVQAALESVQRGYLDASED